MQQRLVVQQWKLPTLLMLAVLFSLRERTAKSLRIVIFLVALTFCQNIGRERFRLKKRKCRLEVYIFPVGLTHFAQNVSATIHSNNLQTVFHFSNLLGRQFAQFAGKCYKFSFTLVVGEDAGLEGLVGFVIDECTNLHPTTSLELQERRRRNDCTHIKIKVEINLG